MGEQHRLVAGSRSDLEYFLTALQCEDLEVARVHPRLADGLAVAYRQRCILVRAMPHTRRNEQVPRRQVHRSQDCEVAHTLRAKLLHEARACARVLLAYGAFHQRAESSSRAWNVTSRCRGVTEMYPSFTADTSVPSSLPHVTEPPPIQ